MHKPISPDIRSVAKLHNPRTVLFDLDGTLRFNHPSSTETFFDYAVSLGAPDSPERRRCAYRWTHYYWAQSDELLVDVQTYPGDDDAFWLNYAVRSLRAFDCPESCVQEIAPAAHTYMTHQHKPVSWVPLDVPETLRLLKAAGYRLGLVTNRSQPCQTELAQLGLLEFFEFALTAGEANAWKPDPAIFLLALQRLGVSADTALYVGDNYYADVIGARQAGLIPILLDPMGLFPEAECLVIQAIGELQPLVH
jgi:HAD superfamily hydrolase (TIGR01509 family)